MLLFARLYHELDATTRTGEKLAALERYFRAAPARDAAWALWFLSGRRLKRTVSGPALRRWGAEVTGLPEWLIEQCYEAVGDGSETLALLLPGDGEGAPPALHELVEQRLRPLSRMDEAGKRELVLRSWRELGPRERFLFHKLLSGTYRVGVAGGLVQRALANVVGVDVAVMAHRLSGDWEPTERDYARITAPDGMGEGGDPGRPYPFMLASPLDADPAALGARDDWQAEWKWDGIRAQLIRRGGRTLLWSRGEELVTEAFPEIAEVGEALPDGTALDGEILAWEGERPRAFSTLQRRINRKAVERTLFGDAVPVVFLVYDALEAQGQDLRARPLRERRAAMETLVSGLPSGLAVRLSPVLEAATWEAAAALQASAREHGVEGIMLKRLDSAYGAGRRVGDWWKWKVDPFTVDAVLMYAQSGAGRRASLYTDYTFGVWDGGVLTPVAKAYSGLSDVEIRRVDAFIKANTLDKRGPVRVVKPELVFELAFEGIQESDRHRAGVALRFPRMHRWRTDKPAAEADTLDSLRALLAAERRR